MMNNLRYYLLLIGRLGYGFGLNSNFKELKKIIINSLEGAELDQLTLNDIKFSNDFSYFYDEQSARERSQVGITIQLYIPNINLLDIDCLGELISKELLKDNIKHKYFLRRIKKVKRKMYISRVYNEVDCLIFVFSMRFR